MFLGKQINKSIQKNKAFGHHSILRDYTDVYIVNNKSTKLEMIKMQVAKRNQEI